VLGIEGATSTEFDPEGRPVISELPEQKEIEGLGGTMRLGAQDVAGRRGIRSPRSCTAGDERSRAVPPPLRGRARVDRALEAAGMVFSGRHPDAPDHADARAAQVADTGPDGDRPAISHPYFVGAQFHPELTSRPLYPQPLFMGLVAAAIREKYEDDEAAGPAIRKDPAMKRWCRTLRSNQTV
jgi:CTP synthase